MSGTFPELFAVDELHESCMSHWVMAKCPVLGKKLYESKLVTGKFQIV